MRAGVDRSVRTVVDAPSGVAAFATLARYVPLVDRMVEARESGPRRVAGALGAVLQTWADRILTAGTAEDVFAD